MANATTETAMDLDTGFGVLFGLLAAAAAGVAFFAHDLLRALGFGGAVLFGALLVASLHLYR
ncbi:MAG: hypothetical protein ABEJ76_04545 [Halanaeroarchaeum sp.]